MPEQWPIWPVAIKQKSPVVEFAWSSKFLLECYHELWKCWAEEFFGGLGLCHLAVGVAYQ